MVGLGLRAVHYLLRRSLWIDEARLAVNVAGRSAGALLQPLAFDQSAPPLFLWALKAVTELFGPGELAFRAVPLLASLATLALMYPVACRLAGPGPAVLATAVFAVAPPLVYFANETKPYATDALVTLGLLALALRCRSGADARAWRHIGAAGAAAVWLSAPAILVLAGLGLALVLHRPSRTGGGARIVAAGGLWLASFAAAYALVYRDATANPYLNAYWAPSLLALASPDVVRRIWSGVEWTLWGTFTARPRPVTASPLERALFLPVTLLLLAFLAAGLARIRRGGGALGLAAAPLVPVAIAVAAGIYPLAPRLFVFAAPLLILLVTAGAGLLADRMSPARRPVAYAALSLVLVAAPLRFALEDLVRWSRPEHARPLIERYLRDGHGEPVYVHPGALPAWAFYTTDWGRPDTARLAFLERMGSSGGPAFENAPSRGHAVSGEGEGLSREYEGRTEVYGVATGSFWPALLPDSAPRPDPGWAANEAARIRRLRAPAVWVLVSHAAAGGPEGELLDSLGGGRPPAGVWYESGAMLARYRLTPSR